MIHYISPIGAGNAWVANELSRVEAAGVPYSLHAMRRPENLFHASEWAVRMNERTLVMYPLPVLDFAVSLVAAPALFRGRFLAALWNALFGRREHLRARIAGIAHLLVACHWARMARRRGVPVAQIHAQWVDACGTIAMYAAWLLDVPFSFTGHAADLFRERCSLHDKIRRAEFIVCISEFHRRFYLKHGARPEQLFTVYCGIDLERFCPQKAKGPLARPYRILASGRLVEKKGFARLIEACRILADRGERFECVIAGNGELGSELRAQVRRLGLGDRVRLTGEMLLQERITEFMHGGDVYVLPCVRARDGDVDGLPQMLVEAMACGLPAISTRLVGIPDLVRHMETGVLVEPDDPLALADAIGRLMHDRPLAARLAAAGRKWVEKRFDLQTCLEPLIDRYRRRLELSAPPRPHSSSPACKPGKHGTVPARDNVAG